MKEYPKVMGFWCVELGFRTSLVNAESRLRSKSERSARLGSLS